MSGSQGRGAGQGLLAVMAWICPTLRRFDTGARWRVVERAPALADVWADAAVLRGARADELVPAERFCADGATRTWTVRVRVLVGFQWPSRFRPMPPDDPPEVGAPRTDRDAVRVPLDDRRTPMPCDAPPESALPAPPDARDPDEDDPPEEPREDVAPEVPSDALLLDEPPVEPPPEEDRVEPPEDEPPEDEPPDVERPAEDLPDDASERPLPLDLPPLSLSLSLPEPLSFLPLSDPLPLSSLSLPFAWAAPSQGPKDPGAAAIKSADKSAVPSLAVLRVT